MQLSGAEGDNAHRINGFYEPIDKMVCNASVYKKLGDGPVVWIEYDARAGGWIVKPTSSRGKGGHMTWATAIISPARPLEDCPGSCWKVFGGKKKSDNQPPLTVSISSRESFEVAYAAYAAEVIILDIHLKTLIYKK